MSYILTEDTELTSFYDVHEGNELDLNTVSEQRYQSVFDELDKIVEESADDQLTAPVTPTGDPLSEPMAPLMFAPASPAAVVESPARDRALQRAIMADAREKYFADARLNGRIAQARRAVDQHRRDAGREAYNEKRRIEYASGIGSDYSNGVRAYEKATPERRAAQKKASKMKRAAALSDDEREAIRASDRLRKREARAAHTAITKLEKE